MRNPDSRFNNTTRRDSLSDIVSARRNLNIAGTLTVLYLGAACGLVEDFPAALKLLLQTGFRASPAIIQIFLDRHAARKKSPPAT